MGSTGREFLPRPKDAPASGGYWNFIPKGTILLLFYLLFAALLIARRPDCISNPQFWAEEGKLFFTDAQQRPAWVNLASYSLGYFFLVIRLISQVAALVPLQYSPLVFVLAALAIQAAVPTFIISSRCANWMGPFPIRLAAALLYCAMPNSSEVHCIALNCRVHLAVLASLIIISPGPFSRWGEVLDGAILILTGLSGPYVLLLAPLAAWRHRAVRTSATRRNYLILLVTFGFAAFAAIASTGQRHPSTELGASFGEGIRILGGRLPIMLLLGEKSYSILLRQAWFDAAAVVAFGFLGFLVIVILCRGRSELRYLLVMGFGSLAMGLLSSPIGIHDIAAWRAFWTVVECGQRYFFLPMAMLLFSLASLAGGGKGIWERRLAIALLILMATIGARVDWRVPAFVDFHFRDYVEVYQALPAGSSLEVPINPRGWHLELRRR